MSTIYTFLLCFIVSTVAVAHNCESKYILIANSNKKVPSVLSVLHENTKQVLQEEYSLIIAKKFIAVDNSSHGKIFANYGVRLAERYRQGDHHAQELLKIGFYLSKDFPDKKERLLPPKDFEVLMTHLSEQAQELLDSGKVKEDELIEFALIFQRPINFLTVQERNAIPRKNNWPKDGYRLNTSTDQTSHEIFYHHARNGEFQFGIDAFLVHDIGHWTELVAYPEIMKGWRKYAHSLLAEPAHGEENMYGWPKIKPTVKATKSFILAEWFSLPDISKTAEIKNLIPHFYEKAPKDYDSDLAYLSKLSLEERKLHFNQIINSEPLLLKFGGALRDHYNLDRFTTEQQLLNMVVDPPADINLRLAQETLHAQVRLLKLLNEIRNNPPSRDSFWEKTKSYFKNLAFNHKEFILRQDEKERNKTLDRVMLEITARVETALYKAVELNLDIETVHKESRLQKPVPNSKTYQYLKSFVPKTWANYYAFEL